MHQAVELRDLKKSFCTRAPSAPTFLCARLGLVRAPAARAIDSRFCSTVRRERAALRLCGATRSVEPLLTGPMALATDERTRPANDPEPERQAS